MLHSKSIHAEYKFLILLLKNVAARNFPQARQISWEWHCHIPHVSVAWVYFYGFHYNWQLAKWYSCLSTHHQSWQALIPGRSQVIPKTWKTVWMQPVQPCAQHQR